MADLELACVPGNLYSQMRPELDDPDWCDMGTYWLNVRVPSGGPRSSRRDWGVQKLLTASSFGVAAGHSNYDSPEVLALEFRTGKRKPMTPERLEAMRIGREYEPIARAIYSDLLQVQVREVGLVVPKFDTRIGASADGLVDNGGCLEIKCPRTVYRDLYRCDLTLRERITTSHYDQMQGTMAIMGLGWCDYFVYGVEEARYAHLRVPYDAAYWELELYPALQYFLSLDLGTSLQPKVRKERRQGEVQTYRPNTKCAETPGETTDLAVPQRGVASGRSTIVGDLPHSPVMGNY